jgi:hypothetical protein
VSDRNRWFALARAGLVSVGVALVGWALPAAASAAAPTPASLTDCGGTVFADPSGTAGGEPNLLDYKFQCDGDISAYTIIVDRRSGDSGNIDDYNPAPSVFESDGVTPSPSETAICEGTTPSDGINCNAGAGAVLSAGVITEGSVDPVEPYCKSLPAKAKPGTPAIPQAIVQLVVTDTTGAEDGPFDLGPAKACPKVPAVVPARKPKTKQAKGKGKGKR